jgi:hypothetical protein
VKAHDADDEIETPEPTTGKVELQDDDHEDHGAGWLYVPDLSSWTGWSSHKVPVPPADQARRRRIGFGR